MRELSSKTAPAATQRVHDLILDYIKEATQGLAKMSINRIRRASIEKDEWDALKTFENVASEQQKMYAKTFCKSTLINYHKKKKNFELVAAHISNDIIPKILPHYDFNLPVDENSLSSEQVQENKENIHNLSKDFRLKATELYLKIVKEEFEFQKERLQNLIDDFPQDRYEIPSTQIDTNIVVDDDDDDEEPSDNRVFTQKPLSQQRQETINNRKGSELFKKYIVIAHKRAQLEIEREVHFLSERGVQETPVETQESKDLNPREEALLKLGPPYIPNNPHLAHKRMDNEIEVVVKKLNKIFVEHGWVPPKERLQIFIDSLEKILTDCHERYPPSVQLKEINNLRNKFEATQTVIRKTDKSKVFHLGKLDDYKVKAQAYMNRTKAYQDLGTLNPLESLVEHTNSFLYGLWFNKHISQRQYEKLKVNREEAELAHLYFLPKAHKPGTPLRPIMAGLKSPTIGISKWLDGLLRPLFDRLASNTTILNGVQLIKRVERWSATYLTSATSFITMDVTDLYTMIPQEGGVTAIKRLIEASGLKQIDGVKKEIILALTRFVMTNNYFYFDGSYYKQIRGGAMGSPLTLTIANAYMYFVERPIEKWANRTCSLYYRYIDDLFIMSNVHTDILKGLVKFWNRIDNNIEFSESIGQTAEYLDVKLGNRGGMHDFSTRFHKLWADCFADTAICNMIPIVGSKRLDNLQDYLVRKKPDKVALKIHT
ncbi:unnamed protein product [Rotaria sp. Silwood1]|nr:unnamed protein product [Rotaria sp. Silwood1]